jgi:transmembrane sensor
MSEILKLRTRTEIDEEAAAWTWRMDSATVTNADRQALEAWLRQDPRHRRAMEELSQVWDALDGLGEAKRDEKIATFTNAARQSLRLGRERWWLAAAAMIVLALAATVWLKTGSEYQTLATAVGQQRSVTLADGSIVTLNTNTILDTRLRRRVRDIYLRKGEAHFQVAHDETRPFLVHAGDAVVRAVGTQFEVRLRTDQHVDVVVNEGRVEVRAAAAGLGLLRSDDGILAAKRPAVRAVRAGEQLSAAGDVYAVTPISTQRLSSEMAWREGAVVFDGESLSEAIVEIERYTDARILINDPEIAALRVGGRFRTGDLQEFFDALQSALPVSVRATSNGTILIGARH